MLKLNWTGGSRLLIDVSVNDDTIDVTRPENLQWNNPKTRHSRHSPRRWFFPSNVCQGNYRSQNELFSHIKSHRFQKGGTMPSRGLCEKRNRWWMMIKMRKIPCLCLGEFRGRIFLVILLFYYISLQFGSETAYWLIRSWILELFTFKHF